VIVIAVAGLAAELESRRAEFAALSAEMVLRYARPWHESIDFVVDVAEAAWKGKAGLADVCSPEPKKGQNGKNYNDCSD